MYKSFSNQFGSEIKTAIEGSLTRKGKKNLKEFCKKYDTPDVDKSQQLLGQVDAVKGQMQKNINTMLKNQENAASLQGKTEALNEQALVFQKRGKVLKKTMAWKELKTTMILVGLVIIVLAIIIVPIALKLKHLKEG